jgi:transketolase
MSNEFKEIDTLCINTIRAVSIDMVQKANSGHPGMPLGMAPLAHILFSRFLNFSSKNPKWV